MEQIHDHKGIYIDQKPFIQTNYLLTFQVHDYYFLGVSKTTILLLFSSQSMYGVGLFHSTTTFNLCVLVRFIGLYVADRRKTH
jgi:hypothetical protein